MRMVTRKVAVLIVLVALILGPASCMKRGPAGKPSNIDYYTCTMHPSVKSQDPNGKCPICSMDLVPVMKKKETEEGRDGETANSPAPRIADSPNSGSMAGMQGMKGGSEMNGAQTREFVVPVERQQQIGVTYARVERKPLRHTIRSVGMVVPDKGRNWQFVSRVDGYVQKLD